MRLQGIQTQYFVFKTYVKFLKNKVQAWVNKKKYKIEKVYKTAIGAIRTYRKEIFIFLHLTVAVFLIIWQLNIISITFLGIPVWMGGIGLYLLFWFGSALFKQFFKLGIHLGTKDN